jgi:hypothetical protein
MKIVNLTPHDMVVRSGEDFVTIPSSGVARCAEIRHRMGAIADTGIQRFAVAYSAVDGLPAPQADTIFIVSAIVRQAVPDRIDVYSPSGLVRDADGRVIGCEGLQ